MTHVKLENMQNYDRFAEIGMNEIGQNCKAIKATRSVGLLRILGLFWAFSSQICDISTDSD